MAFLKKKAPVVIDGFPNNSHPDAFMDVYAQEFADENEVEVVAKVRMETSDPKELRGLAKWCEKAATYLERHTKL